ncbi:hypothetical protein RAS1_41200 [Phycisphaerae bacterium RAS1]|nr:hypothetical protein RAS1_41200 [Phycisphaerae bacterium RAS1]
MASGNTHTEFFGPDLGRGPNASDRLETAVVEIATALAQLRAPLTRSDDDLRAHADFIRDLADRLAPDSAVQVNMTVGDESANAIQTSIRLATTGPHLLRCWLADDYGGAETSAAPASVTWNSGVVLQTVTALKHFWIVTPATGVADVTVNYVGPHVYYWAVARAGLVKYSGQLYFL